MIRLFSKFNNINKVIKNFFFCEISPQLGRWRLKHNQDECNSYMSNYADPGYHQRK